MTYCAAYPGASTGIDHPPPYSLGELQRIFPLLLSHLIHFTYHRAGEKDGKRYELRIGWGYRPPEIAESMGFKNSNHTRWLAQDFDLYIDGEYQPSTEAHKPLGEYWESLSTEGIKCCWGGQFGDGNHYSIEYTGIK